VSSLHVVLKPRLPSVQMDYIAEQAKQDKVAPVTAGRKACAGACLCDHVRSPQELDAALCSFGAAFDAALDAAWAALAGGSQSQAGVELESVPRMKVLAPASYLSAQVVSASKVPLGLGAGVAMRLGLVQTNIFARGAKQAPSFASP
jgi:hypothetical protein